jgi:surface carbohydrate biosynthesis protein
MKESKTTLLIPVENQVRELDPKLLLACVAATRGFDSVIGPRREMHFYIPSFPRSIYVSKSITSGSKTVFHNLRRLGHEIVAWDEEALVHLPPENYYKHRMSRISLGFVSHLLAWGEDNDKLWRQYPDFPSETPIKITVTGNPRGDLLRPEIRIYYNNEAKQIHERYGNFILMNTNFGMVNAFHSGMNLIPPSAETCNGNDLSRKASSLGLNRKSAEALRDHKQAIFKDFQLLIPELEKAFPEHNVVVRPHPSENQDVYHRIASNLERVKVTNEGNVVPWLMATKALIHNGCTTAVEAYALNTPAISYRASVNEQYDNAYHDLANKLSHQCFNLEELIERLSKIIAGDNHIEGADNREELIKKYLAAQDGPLACDRMVDVFETVTRVLRNSKTPSLYERFRGRLWAAKRRLNKRFKGYRTNLSHNRSDFLRHRYPKISLEELKSKLSQFQSVLGHHTELKVEQIFHQFYRISNR